MIAKKRRNWCSDNFQCLPSLPRSIPMKSKKSSAIRLIVLIVVGGRSKVSSNTKIESEFFCWRPFSLNRSSMETAFSTKETVVKSSCFCKVFATKLFSHSKPSRSFLMHPTCKPNTSDSRLAVKAKMMTTQQNGRK